MTLATLLSRTLQGLEVATGACRSGRRAGLAGLLGRRVARDGRQGKQGQGPGGAGQLRFRISGRTRHGQSRARRPAEGRRPFRPRHRHRYPRGLGPVAAGTLRRHRTLWRTFARRRTARRARRVAQCAAGRPARPHARRARRPMARRPRLARKARVFVAAHLRDVCAFARGQKPLSAPTRAPAAAAARRHVPTWPTCAGRQVHAARWKLRRLANTACCSSARPAAARACSRKGCPACCRRWSEAEAIEIRRDAFIVAVRFAA